MLRLERDRSSRVLRVIGRIEADNLAELNAELESHPLIKVLELGEVTLADVDAVHFLATAEASGAELRNCPLFIREWMRREHPELVET